jgi:hypothetical protein
MFKRDRVRQSVVKYMHISDISTTGILQIGDVYDSVNPFSYAEAYAGYRGAPSFNTHEVLPRMDTRLHYANQVDEDVRDYNIYGEQPETFRPNVRGVEAL